MNNIRTSIEGKRGCGYRQPGGLYIVSPSEGRYCGALPVELGICPTCHHGIKPARGWTWINLADLTNAQGCKSPDSCGGCPIADAKIQKVGLIWIGEKFYPTVEDFIKEASSMGISRRISAIPREFKLGETWIALAHRKCIPVETPPGATELDLGFPEITYKPGIFRVFKPIAIEYIVRGNESDQQLEKLEKRGISLVNVIRKGE